MDRQPVLTGERLVLRPLVAGDWDALWAIANDRELWAMHPVPDRWQEPVFRAFFADALADGGTLVAFERASGDAPERLVACSRFDGDSAANGGQIEIGRTFLARNRWGSGLNAEMKRLMLGHAFGSAERVIFRVGEDNFRSRRAMGKIGAKPTGEIERVTLDGREIVHVLYAITRADFATGPLSGPPGARQA